MTGFQPTGFDNRGFADQLNIQTPEQVDIRFPVAGVGSRFVAVLIDHLIQLAPYVLILIFALIFGSSLASSGASRSVDGMDTLTKWIIAFFVFLNFLWFWGYFSLFEAYWKGQTPGKRIMKLRVIKDSGRQITLFEAMARNLIRFVDYLPGMYLAGVVTMVCNRANKRLGDLAAGTLVVHEIAVESHGAESFLMGENFFTATQNLPTEGTPPADAVARLDAADLHVIETFFARALDLDIATRAAMAQRIAERIAAKMKVGIPAGNPERMLEAVAKAMRGVGRRY